MLHAFAGQPRHLSAGDVEHWGAGRSFVDELLVRERGAVDEGYVFGGTPVIYRELRSARGGRGARATDA